MEYWVRLYFLTTILCITMCIVNSFPRVTELRLSLADVASSYNNYEPEGSGTYAFGYDIDDPETQNVQFRDEERKPNGSVIGKYGWVADDGTVYIVNYIADEWGYRANVENIPNYKLRGINPFRRNAMNLERQ